MSGMHNARYSASTVIVIPARLHSERLPGKLLLRETGKPLIQHTYEAACQSKLAEAVCVATGDTEIADAVRDFGGNVVTSTDGHANGTSRVAEAVREHFPKAEIIVNLQGDEPEVSGEAIDSLVAKLRDTKLEQGSIATLVAIPTRDELQDENCAKVAVSWWDSRALYFSRAPLRGAYRHIGVYAFRRATLLAVANPGPVELARLENLEQLAWLEDGETILVSSLRISSHSINTAADYAAFVDRFAKSDIS